MKATRFHAFVSAILIGLCVSCLPPGSLHAAPWDPAATDYAGRKGTTIYVSKRGDNTDGTSWEKAFHTVQKGMSAVPDDQGGHRVIIRPDTYLEQNIYATHKGAAGAYNVLQADFDGSLGSGATGYAVFDASHPTRGHTTDIAGPYIANSFLQSRDASGEIWDRWIVRHVYAAGGDAGVFWDIRFRKAEPLTIVVEDCVGIGRAFGGGVAGHIMPRADEPVVFRRCWLCTLDWIGDAAAAYVRAHNRAMPKSSDAIFEDCTLVSPDNVFQAGNPGLHGYTRVRFKNCRMISLNFAMPGVATPAPETTRTGAAYGTGIIRSFLKGEYLNVELQDCQMMGFKVFHSGDGNAIPYSTKGQVSAYIHAALEVPEGFSRMGPWPAKLFEGISPPKTGLYEP